MKWSTTHINRFDCELDYSLRDKVKTFKEEMVDHLKYVVEKHEGGEIYLLLSGGMDSRLLGLVLLDIGVKFTAVTYGYDLYFKDVDSVSSIEFAKEHGIKHEIFYLDLSEVMDTIYKYNQIDFFMPILNTYYILSAVNRYYKPNCAFITGAGSEPKITDGKIPIAYNAEKLKQLHTFIYNFTTDRILFSFANDPIVKENWNNKLFDKFDVRNMVYQKAYPSLKLIEKVIGGDYYIRNHFYTSVYKDYCRKYPHLFAMNPMDYFFDLEEYYNGGVNNGS